MYFGIHELSKPLGTGKSWGFENSGIRGLGHNFRAMSSYVGDPILSIDL